MSPRGAEGRWASERRPARLGLLLCLLAGAALGVACAPRAGHPRARMLALREVALAAKGQGDLALAVEARRSALALAAATWGDSVELAVAERELGAAVLDRGDMRAAADHFERAARLLERRAPASVELAQVTGDLASVAMDLGELDRAQKGFERAVSLLERRGDRRALAPVLGSFGHLVRKRGDYAAAERYCRRAAEIWMEVEPGGVKVASALTDLGVIAWVRGDWGGAQQLLERAEKLYADRAPGHPGLIDTLNTLGVLALYRGDLEVADGYLHEALSRREKSEPDSFRLVPTLTSLGFVAFARGDWELAQADHARALAILQQAGCNLDLPSALLGLAEVERARDQLAAAERHCEPAIELLEIQAPGSPQLGSALLDRADIALARGDLALARRTQERGLAILEATTPASLDTASMLLSLAETVERSGDRPAAIRYLKRALAITDTTGPESVNAADILHRLGSLERARRPALAARYMTRAVDALERRVEHLGGSSTLRMGFAAQRETYYRDLVELLIDQHRPREAFAVLERSRGRGLLAMLAERDLAFSLDVPPALREERRRIAREYDAAGRRIAELDPRRDAAQFAARFASAAQELRDLRRRHDDVAERIRQASPRLAALQLPRPLDDAGARRALDPGTVMLSFSVGKERTDLFVVAPGRPLAVEAIPIGEDELRRLVGELRALIPEARAGSPRGRAQQERLLAVARRLFQLLISPAAERIAAADRVLVVPDGPLHLVPWAALVREAPGEGGRGWQYFVEWKPVHLALSATVYAELRRSRRTAAAAARPLVAFGDPVMPRGKAGALPDDGPPQVADLRLRSAADRGFSFSPLPWSRREAERIVALHREGARLYLGADATEERAKAIGKAAGYVHFATHSTLDESSPLDSAVVLSIPERSADRDNGLLQAWEIFDGVRLDAELVVLSGCASGLGRELRGEGLLGLTRAFQYAGARSVAASLWEVEDRMTAELMERFYRHLFAGEPKDEALRRAQLELIRRPLAARDEGGRPTGADTSAPFYWAPFQIYGDWR